MRATLCVMVCLAAGTAWATDWTGYERDVQTVAYQLGEGQDVPPPPVPDPDQAPLTDPVGRAADEPSCAAASRAPVEPTCGTAAVRLAYDEPACGYAAAAPVCVQTVRVPVVQYRTVRVPVRVVQQVECAQQVQCATAPLAIGGGHCARRSRGRLLGGRLCARHHGGAAVGFAAATECAVAAPVCGG